MAEDTQDKSEKTEEPTQRKLDEALKKGQVSNSKEVSNFLMLFTFSLVIVWLAPITMQVVRRSFYKYVSSPHLIEVSPENLQMVMAEAAGFYGVAIMPIIIATLTAAFVSGFAQHAPVFSFESITPKLEKISVLKGLKRMFSMRSLTEFIKGLIKIVLVGVVAFFALWPLRTELDTISGLDILGIMLLIQSVAVKIMIGVLTFMMFVAIIDFIYQQFEHKKNLRMSRQDIKEEMKQTEGDPHIKAKLKQIRMERVRRRMMAAVPDADVVVTNPTHFSVALKYDQGTMTAPIVVAKGLDHIALKIREIAEANDIPLVENPPLARALYDSVEIDEEVPFEFYQAVAEVISHVYKLKNKKAA